MHYIGDMSKTASARGADSYVNRMDPVATLAMFIAAALQHPSPPCNDPNKRISTIAVEQHKNKFGAVVVYCELANDGEVDTAYGEAGRVGPVTDDFRAAEWRRDARRYRDCYMGMIALVQQYKDIMLALEDYPELLLSKVTALDPYLATTDDVHSKSNADWFLHRWNKKPALRNAEDVRALIRKAYEVTLPWPW